MKRNPHTDLFYAKDAIAKANAKMVLAAGNPEEVVKAAAESNLARFNLETFKLSQRRKRRF